MNYVSLKAVKRNNQSVLLRMFFWPNMALKGTCRLRAVLKFYNLQALGFRLASVSGAPLTFTLGI
jgi:hypothetical protein